MLRSLFGDPDSVLVVASGKHLGGQIPYHSSTRTVGVETSMNTMGLVGS
jgi:hypothetical protein